MDFLHLPHWPFRPGQPDIRKPGPLASLSINRLIGTFASDIIGLFFPIFIYEQFGHSLKLAFLWYAVSYVLRLPFIIWGAKVFSRIGMAVSMMLGTAAWILFYVAAYLLDSGWGSINVWALHAVMMATATLVTALYWAPYHIDFTVFGSNRERGRQLGLLYAISILLGLIGPLLGGMIVAAYSYQATFAIGMVLMSLSVIPLLVLPKVEVSYDYGYLETFRKMASRRFRPFTLSMAAYGGASGIAVTAWPIFLFMVFDGQHLSIGIFASVIAAIGIALQLTVGRMMDRMRAEGVLRAGVGLYSAGWVFKALVDTVGGAFAASTFHNFSDIVMGTPRDYLTYEKAARMRNEMDEFIVMRELAISVGRGIVMLLAALLCAFFPLQSVFLLAAVISVGMGLVARFTVPEG